MKLASHGIDVDLPSGWEGRISLRGTPAGAGRALGANGEVAHPIAHLANFPLPAQRGDFGSGAVDTMGSGDLLVVLFEYGPESLGKALFKRQGIPTTLTPSMFSPSALQRTLPNQAGCQVFFTENDRAFCCYVVLGQHREAATLVPKANATLKRTRISPR